MENSRLTLSHAEQRVTFTQRAENYSEHHNISPVRLGKRCISKWEFHEGEEQGVWTVGDGPGPVCRLVGAAAQVNGELSHVSPSTGQHRQQLQKVHSPDVAPGSAMFPLL